jgi:hypothetical protein
VTYCYELMDLAYEAHHIEEQSRQLGHVPTVDSADRGRKQPGFLATPRELSPVQRQWYKEHTMVEGVNAQRRLATSSTHQRAQLSFCPNFGPGRVPRETKVL